MRDFIANINYDECDLLTTILLQPAISHLKISMDPDHVAYY